MPPLAYCQQLWCCHVNHHISTFGAGAKMVTGRHDEMAFRKCGRTSKVSNPRIGRKEKTPIFECSETRNAADHPKNEERTQGKDQQPLSTRDQPRPATEGTRVGQFSCVCLFVWHTWAGLGRTSFYLFYFAFRLMGRTKGGNTYQRHSILVLDQNEETKNTETSTCSPRARDGASDCS